VCGGGGGGVGANVLCDSKVHAPLVLAARRFCWSVPSSHPPHVHQGSHTPPRGVVGSLNIQHKLLPVTAVAGSVPLVGPRPGDYSTGCLGLHKGVLHVQNQSGIATEHKAVTTAQARATGKSAAIPRPRHSRMQCAREGQLATTLRAVIASGWRNVRRGKGGAPGPGSRRYLPSVLV
jgi:hypothetical protein